MDTFVHIHSQIWVVTIFETVATLPSRLDSVLFEVAVEFNVVVQWLVSRVLLGKQSQIGSAILLNGLRVGEDR